MSGISSFETSLRSAPQDEDRLAMPLRTPLIPRCPRTVSSAEGLEGRSTVLQQGADLP